MQFRNFSKSVCLAVLLPSTSLKGKLSVAWLLWGFQHYLRVFHSCFSPLLVVRSRRQEVPVPSLTSICNLSQKIPFATPFTWTQSNTSLCSHLFLFLWRKTSKIGYIHLRCCSCRENLSPAALGDQEPNCQWCPCLVFGDLHASQSFTDRGITDTETIGEFLTSKAQSFPRPDS